VVELLPGMRETLGSVSSTTHTQKVLIQGYLQLWGHSGAKPGLGLLKSRKLSLALGTRTRKHGQVAGRVGGKELGTKSSPKDPVATRVRVSPLGGF
jgi:hypothetical protein